MFYIIRDLIGHFFSPCALSDGIWEYMDISKTNLFGKGTAFGKILICFTGETRHDIGGYGTVGKSAAQLLYKRKIFIGGIVPVHCTESFFAAALE